MEEAWQRAVEAACGGEDPSSVRSLTLDGALKCSQSRLPPASLLEQFSQLRVLSIANVGLASLADFPSLPYLERLILSDNRIAGGLGHLVQAGLSSLQDLDLSNNKIQLFEDLAPLAELHLLSLDLYECPVTRRPDYRSKVFGMMKSLQYLDKLDAENNERPESDEEEDDDEDAEEVDDELVDGVGGNGVEDDIVNFTGRKTDSRGEEEEDVGDEDDQEDDGDESDELDEEDDDGALGTENHLNQTNEDTASDEEEVDDEDENIDDTENVEVHEESEDESEEEDDGIEDEEDDDDEEGATEQASGPFRRAKGELDLQGNEEDEDENGELGDEDENGESVDEENAEVEVEDEEEEEEDYGTEYLVQPIGEAQDEETASDFDPGDDTEEDEDIEDDDGDESSPSLKRKRDEDTCTGKDERPPKKH